MEQAPHSRKEPIAEGRRREDLVPPEHPEDDVKRVLRELIPQGSRAEFIDRGSEKLVFKFNPPEQPGNTPNRQSIVYKVDYRESLFKEGKARDLHDPHTQEKTSKELQETIKLRKKEIERLRTVFGLHAVPPERSSVQMLPMSADLYNAIKRHDIEALEHTPNRIPSLVTIQKRIELDPSHTIDLASDYAETPRRRPGDAPQIDQEVYEAAHRRLIGDLFQTQEHQDPEERKKALTECVALYPSLKRVIRQAEEDSAFREQLKKAAQGLVTYAKSPEGTVLDVAGGHNIVIAEKAGSKEGEKEWQLYLLDALSPKGGMNLNHLTETAKKISERKEVTSDDRIEALNAFHMVRMANAFAIIADIPDRAQLPEEVRKVPSFMWRSFLEDAWSKKERKEASQPESAVPPAATRVA